MQQDEQQLQEQIIAIVETIYRAESISDDQKQHYIDAILENGITEEMVKELTPHFESEVSRREKNIQRDKQALEKIEAFIKEEAPKVDEQQATVLANLEDFQERNIQDMQKEYEELDQEFDQFEEKIVEESADSAEEAIRQKLGLK